MSDTPSAGAPPERPTSAPAALLALAIGATAWSVAIVAAGGIDVRRLGIPLVARTAWPSAVSALALLSAHLLWRGGQVDRDWRRLVATARRLATPLAAGLSVGTLALSVHFATFAVGGSDSNCYVAQAERWASGTMLEPLRPGFEANWPDAALSLTPTGFVPSRRVEGAIAPICPAGLALAMAAPRALGAPPASVFYVVPLLAGLAVFCVYLVGQRLAGSLSGLASAGIAAASPVFLYQAFQPMSDVPAAAFWLLALALAAYRTRTARLSTGFAVGAAVLMRPNLAPLAALFVAFAAIDAGHPGRHPGSMMRRAGVVVVGLVPAVATVGLVQDLLYGSPLSSGYGSLDSLFRLSHVPANLARFPRWLIDTQSAFVLLGVLAPALVMWRRQRAGGFRERDGRFAYADLCWLFALGAFAAYLPYVPFDGWWFLRFWLPGVLPLVALAVSVVTMLVAAVSPDVRGAAAGGRTVGLVAGLVALLGGVTLVAWQLGVARDRSVFDLQRFERKFVVSGNYVGTLPASAVVLTIWHSGAVSYYGERPAVVWDAIAPSGLDAVVSSLRAQGREVYLLLEPREEDAFRGRFGRSSAFAALDWPPRARFGNEVTLWALGDRERFIRGETTPTERVWVR
jgi:hypothetical protein